MLLTVFPSTFLPENSTIIAFITFMHRVNLLDIEIDLGDVLPETEVIQYFEELKVE